MLIIKKNNINKLKNYGFKEGNFYDWDVENHYIKDKKYKSLYFRFLRIWCNICQNRKY